jgi:hypothetical protein
MLDDVVRGKTAVHNAELCGCASFAAADPRYKGKQLQTNPGHKGVAGARDQKTLFEEKFKMLYEGEKYSQQNYYNVDMAVRTPDPLLARAAQLTRNAALTRATWRLRRRTAQPRSG